ncbi:DUF1715-domain-containing protein [Xylariomycetidae sp. FL0641]|nr:DUF1715-domain-containing protein [Xylariomycetidae sp. FL0641]
MSGDDLFDDVLNIEEQAYQEGYDQGFKDGEKAGRIEGTSVGLKTGFEKFLEAGRLQSKAIVWANRIPNFQQKAFQMADPQQDVSKEQAGATEPNGSQNQNPAESQAKLPPINSNARLEKNIMTLYGLVEPGTLSTKNDDESVNDFDSRMKGAQGKLKMIERVVGEGAERANATKGAPSAEKNGNIEDIGRIRQTTDAENTKG